MSRLEELLSNREERDGYDLGPEDVTNIPSRTRWQMERDAHNAAKWRWFDKNAWWMLFGAIVLIAIAKTILYPGVPK